MHCINLLYLIFMFFVHYYLFCSVVCTLMMSDMSHTKTIDLSFNNVIEDSCDYLDYSNIETVLNFNGLAILQHNIHGVLGKQDSLKLLLNNIRRDCRVQVIMLAEIWLNKNNVKRVKIPGYSFVRSHRKSKCGGGVGILMSQNLEYRQRKDLSLNVPNFESITVEVKTHESGILFCTIYRPPTAVTETF